MATKLNLVHLSAEERAFLEPFARSYRHSARERTRARILLLADEDQAGGSATDVAVAQQLRTTAFTVERVRRRYVEGGLERALFAKEQEHRAPRRLDGAAEAHLIALTCAAPPEGYKRWSLRLLRDTLIEQGYVDSVSHESVRRTLKKTRSSRG